HRNDDGHRGSVAIGAGLGDDRIAGGGTDRPRPWRAGRHRVERVARLVGGLAEDERRDGRVESDHRFQKQHGHHMRFRHSAVIGMNFTHIVDSATGSGTAGPECWIIVRTESSIVATRTSRLHYAWIVAGVSFVAILGAAGFRAVPSVFMNPLHAEFGWSHATVGAAISVNMVLFGVTAPFAAALMDRFGVRPVLAGALVLIATGTGVGLFMTASWQLILLWGVLVGLGTGSLSMGFVATVSTRWFVAR